MAGTGKKAARTMGRNRRAMLGKPPKGKRYGGFRMDEQRAINHMRAVLFWVCVLVGFACVVAFVCTFV